MNRDDIENITDYLAGLEQRITKLERAQRSGTSEDYLPSNGRCKWYTNGKAWALWTSPLSQARCVRPAGHEGPHE